MPIKTITAPAWYTVSLAEAKLYLRATSDASEDDLITSLIVSATRLFEHETGISVAAQTRELTLDNFPDAIKLEFPPVQSIDSIKYDDIDGVEQTLSSLDYKLDNASDKRGWIVPIVGKVWPDTYAAAINAVRVRYVTGFVSASVVPDEIKLWIKAHVATWYENRSADTPDQTIRQPALDGIVRRYRIFNL